MENWSLSIAEQATRGQQKTICLLQDLIREQASGEAAVQARVAEAAREQGLLVEEVRYRPTDVPIIEEFASPGVIDSSEQLAVVATWPGTGNGRRLIVFAHPDGEPPSRFADWKLDPFAGTISGERLYGWGVADDLAGVAAMFGAISILKSAGFSPAGDVYVASTPSKRHRRGLTALLARGLDADAALYLHPAESGCGLSDIKAFSSGQVEFLVTVAGAKPDTNEPIQSTFAHRAVSPINNAMLVHRALGAMNKQRAQSVRHPALDGHLGRSTDLLLSFVSCGSSDSLYRAPTRCVLGGALSFPPSETIAAVKEAIAGAVRKAADKDAWLSTHTPTIEWVSGMPGAEVPESHALFQIASESVKTVTGTVPRMNALHTTSDIRNPIIQRGIPTIGLGPLCGNLAQNGHTDEWVDVEDYVRCVTVAAEIIARWCGLVRVD